GGRREVVGGGGGVGAEGGGGEGGEGGGGGGWRGGCDGNMEEGSLRCDCNVSVRRPGEPLGTRCEIKNLNSIRYVMQAIDYEAQRQVDIFEEGGRVEQQTRLFDAGRGITRPMRPKEDANDYRYFPDPDLLPLVLDPQWVTPLR